MRYLRWTNLAIGGGGPRPPQCPASSAGPGTIGGQTIFQTVQTAIQQQVKQSQNASATLNSLNWGNPTQVTYSATFVPAPPELILNPNEDASAGGTLDVTLFIPGNSLTFTASVAGNPTFDVSFNLTVSLQLTFPLSLNSITPWAVGVSASAQVEVLNVTTHNVLVSLCNSAAVEQVLQAINGYIVAFPDLGQSGLGAFEPSCAEHRQEQWFHTASPRG